MTIKLRPYQEAAIRALQANPVSTMYLPYRGPLTFTCLPQVEAAIDGVLTLETLARAKASLMRSPERLIAEPVAYAPPQRPLVIRPVRPNHYRESIEVKPMHCPFKITLITLAVRNVLGGRHAI